MNDCLLNLTNFNLFLLSYSILFFKNLIYEIYIIFHIKIYQMIKIMCPEYLLIKFKVFN